MRVFRGASEILNAKGEELGCSEWVTVTQKQVDTFAEATYDDQWIHVDTGRAASGPFGGTIAHGHLTLSLLPYLASQIYRFEGVSMRINYGLNKVRFPQPVRVGSRVRARYQLVDVVDVGPQLQLTTRVSIEIDGEAKPACVAESLSRIVP